MKIDDTKIINKISNAQGVNFQEAEKAITMFYKIIGEEIAAGTESTIEVKHLGKFIPKKRYDNGRSTSNISGRSSDV